MKKLFRKEVAIIIFVLCGVCIVPFCGLSLFLDIAFSSGSNVSSTNDNATPFPTIPGAPAGTIFQSDFKNKLYQWKEDNGSWGIVQDGDQLRYKNLTGDKSEALAGDTNWTNYTYEASMKVTTFTQGTGSMGLIVRDEGSGYTRYFFGYGNGSLGGYWMIWKVELNYGQLLAHGGQEDLQANHDYRLKAVADGSKLQLYVDGVLKIETIDPADSINQSGRIGFSVNNATASFADVKVVQIQPSIQATASKTVKNVGAGILNTIVGIIFLILISLLVLSGIFVFYFLFLKPRTVELGTSHGSAHFAGPNELTGMVFSPQDLHSERENALQRGQRPPSRLVIGSYQNQQLLTLDERRLEEHVLLDGTSGKGKSSLFIIPNILREEGARSLFITDPKPELFDKCAGALSKRGFECWIFAPTREGAATSQAYNPLEHIEDIEDARDFARCWVRNTGESKEEFWNSTAELLITAVVMHVRKSEPDAPLSRLADIFCGMDFPQIWNMIDTSPSIETRNAGRAIMSNMQRNERLAGSIMTGLNTRFFFLQSPIIQRVTDHNEIDFDRMITQPIAFFLSIPDVDADKLKPISSCLFMQMIKSWARIAYSSPNRRLPRGITCYLDEFANIGSVPHMARHVTTLRSKGIALILAIQNHNQLIENYGKDDAQTIMASTSTHMVLGGSAQPDCKFYSERIGFGTIATWSESTSSRGFETSNSSSMSPTGRLLMTPDEIRTLQRGQILVIADTLPPTVVLAEPYYENAALANLSRTPYTMPRVTVVEGKTKPPRPKKESDDPDAGFFAP